ncbi:MAG: tyrosinase family protein [Actinomycetota bacterium]|nr:tyrosinase family protein [Actinomycetota bacterium]
MGENDADQVVDAPTYMADIRFFFRPVDVQHMRSLSIQLATYDGVKHNALNIYEETAPPNANMPPDAAGKWSAARSQTFRNWITSGYPLGTATPQTLRAVAASAGRERKNVTSLSAQEIDTLKTAFTGLMDRDPSRADSYFAIAGIHGLPQMYCLHHVNLYNPWHRAYLKYFEDALRSVPGCEDVTIPYWDISTPLPELLQQPPFASYELPLDPGAAADPPQSGYFPYTTSRDTPAGIEQNVQAYGVLEDIATSLQQSVWGSYNINGYQDFSIQAHDGGHGSIGGASGSMSDQNVASFDPVFWFFHCNLDRLWLKWQGLVGATTLHGFQSTVTGDTTWLELPLTPFPTTGEETIDFGISYDEEGLEEGIALENKAGSLEAARRFSIKRSSPVSVRVKDIDRLAIPGSFVVNLMADDESVAKRFFFQPRSPQNCENCKTQALVNIDFRIDAERLLDRTLSVAIEVPAHQEIGTSFPLSRAGNPTINARLLLDET